MNNAILKSISATNFGPFNGTITFDMETSVPKGQIIDNHTFIAGDNQQFNKIAYIYGANGSGKSNFCKIILIKRAVILLNTHQMNTHFIFRNAITLALHESVLLSQK